MIPKVGARSGYLVITTPTGVSRQRRSPEAWTPAAVLLAAGSDISKERRGPGARKTQLTRPGNTHIYGAARPGRRLESALQGSAGILAGPLKDDLSALTCNDGLTGASWQDSNLQPAG
jgi:hypothetical protein